VIDVPGKLLACSRGEGATRGPLPKGVGTHHCLPGSVPLRSAAVKDVLEGKEFISPHCISDVFKKHVLALATPAQVLRTLNRFLFANNESQMYVTMSACILDLRTEAIEYSDGGHEPSFILGHGAEWKCRKKWEASLWVLCGTTYSGAEPSSLLPAIRYVCPCFPIPRARSIQQTLNLPAKSTSNCRKCPNLRH
jgi:hypothetical protein